MGNEGDYDDLYIILLLIGPILRRIWSYITEGRYIQYIRMHN